MERFTKGHLPEDIEREHLGPLGHIDADGVGPALLADDAHEVVHSAAHDGLLLEERALRECGREHLPHLGVLYRVALAPDAEPVEPRPVDVVEGRLDRRRVVPRGRVPVDGFP